MSVKHIFLALLTEEELHGYELKQHYDQLLLHETQLNFGQVYSTLLRLERDNLISLRENGSADKKIYAITELGRQELYRWLMEPGKENMVLFDELSYKLAAMQVLSSEGFLQMIAEYKKLLISQMQRLTKKKLETPKEQLGPYLLLERSILKLEADIRWADRCLELLQKGDGI